MIRGDADGGRADRLRRTATAVAAALAIAALLGTSGGVQAAETVQSTQDPALVVDLDAEGDATVTLVTTYDLADAQERAAFETVQNDSETRQALADRFAGRMASVAADASAATGREITVGEASVDLAVDGDTGVAQFTVPVSNLAAVEGDRVVLTEPFASGYAPDRPLVVLAPEGYALAAATPSADVTGDGAATWTAGTDLSGFEATFEPAEGGTDGESAAADEGEDAGGDPVPGFGVGAAVLALTAVAARIRR